MSDICFVMAMPSLLAARANCTRTLKADAAWKVIHPDLVVHRGCCRHQLGEMLYSSSRARRSCENLEHSVKKCLALACACLHQGHIFFCVGSSGRKYLRVGVLMAPQRQIISIVKSAAFSELTHLLHFGALDISRSIAEVPSASNLELWMLESRMRRARILKMCAQAGSGLRPVRNTMGRMKSAAWSPGLRPQWTALEEVLMTKWSWLNSTIWSFKAWACKSRTLLILEQAVGKIWTAFSKPRMATPKRGWLSTCWAQKRASHHQLTVGLQMALNSNEASWKVPGAMRGVAQSRSGRTKAVVKRERICMVPGQPWSRWTTFRALSGSLGWIGFLGESSSWTKPRCSMVPFDSPENIWVLSLLMMKPIWASKWFVIWSAFWSKALLLLLTTAMVRSSM